jgi:nitrogen fixation protein
MIKKEKNQDSFLGSKILIRNGARLELPFKKKDEPIAVWKIISKFIG